LADPKTITLADATLDTPLLSGGLRAALSASRERVLLLVRRVLLFATLPALCLVLFVQARNGGETRAVLVELVATAIVCTGLMISLPLSARCGLVVGYMVLLSSVALGFYGPTIGTGLFFLGALLSASFFLEPRAIPFTFGVLVLVLVALAIGISNGKVRPSAFVPDAPGMFRMTLATGITLAGAGLIFHFIQTQLRKSILAEIGARESEHAAQLARERAMRAMEVSQRLEALGRLAGGVAHDINNALTVIQVGVEELCEAGDTSEHTALIEEVRGGVARATTTARQLLAFSRGSVEPAGVCQPWPSSTRTIQSVKRMFPANISFHVAGGSTSTIGLSAGAFEQVLLNLLLNARDAMPNGGAIELGCKDEDGMVSVTVHDQGVGMSPEHAGRVFEPFFTTKGNKGTGLGLSMVRTTVTGVGGSVALESVPGEGTTVRLLFPIIVKPRTTHAPVTVQSSSAVRVLLLEYQRDVAQAMVRILSKSGHKVDAVTTVREAVDRIALQHYSLFITDGQVPDGSVFTAIDVFRQSHSDGRVILCSGFAEDSTLVADASRQWLKVLRKPFMPAELTSLVASVVSRST
jgi:signal transduction histidine kinase/CheY-like chemotaxis protein